MSKFGPKPEPLDWARCGTEANYRKHLRHGEKPCQACTAAARRANRDRTLRRRQARASAPSRLITL